MCYIILFKVLLSCCLIPSRCSPLSLFLSPISPPPSSFSPSFMPVDTEKLPSLFNACSLVLLNLTNHVAISPNQCKGYIAKVKNTIYSEFNAKLG